MDLMGQQTQTRVCPECDGDTVVFTHMDKQICDQCDATFTL